MMNIAGHTPIVDAFYRYEMPRLVTRTEKGVKQVIVNLAEVADSLGRQPEAILKFYEYELNTRTAVEKDGKHVVTGPFTASQFQNLLSDYIDKFVLCGVCGNPETTYRVQGEKLRTKCKACGEKWDLDMNHRLSSWIVSRFLREYKVKKKSKKPVDDTEVV